VDQLIKYLFRDEKFYFMLQIEMKNELSCFNISQ